MESHLAQADLHGRLVRSDWGWFLIKAALLGLLVQRCSLVQIATHCNWTFVFLIGLLFLVLVVGVPHRHSIWIYVFNILELSSIATIVAAQQIVRLDIVTLRVRIIDTVIQIHYTLDLGHLIRHFLPVTFRLQLWTLLVNRSIQHFDRRVELTIPEMLNFCRYHVTVG